MSDETRKDVGGTDQPNGGQRLPHREEVMPKDHETYTPQGGGAGTGSGPIKEVEAAEKKEEAHHEYNQPVAKHFKRPRCFLLQHTYASVALSVNCFNKGANANTAATNIA